MTTTAGVDHRPVTLRVTAARRRLVGLVLDGAAWVESRTERPRAAVRPVTSVVTTTAWTVGALAVTAAISATRLDWVELRVAALFVLALLAVCAVFVLGSHQLVARLDLTRDRVVVGERANGRLVLTNESARRSLPMTIELPVGPAKAAFDLPSLGSKVEHEDLFAIPTSRRAVLTVGPVRTVRADPLALLRREQDLTDQQLLYVHPRTVRIQGSAAGFIRDLEGQTIRKLTDSDVAFHALRAYVPGDDRRYIHWKTTARTGTMMVRQFEETRRSHLLVALSTRLDDYASDEEFELAVSAAGSLGVQAFADDQQISAATSGRHLRAPHAKALLDELSGVDYERNAARLSDVARRLGREVQGASVAVVLCGSVVDPAELRRVRRFLPLDVRTIVVRADVGGEPSIRSIGDVDISTIADLDDLGTAMRRLAA
ncbi:DUF58 domain-containing protein [Aeromicrobium fastidiosum]|uniref:DUF58 domain-containing protein n=1 Tax=Aeromicrobium fastidiosum TaxID=52699 RepID=A0A641ALA0_9ACTN|nr:DUF58 domain-containing protein [Aeromicrobium fastidiosum]KAA1374684.1 DUF58 domain-containing protein [Aeromicrobium fastidiosum]MBP2390769.1 uncharacterized protein (DUF58 family) [Aeromicrobium fastidiosum]